MGIYRHFPYTNFHEMNLDEIIKIVKQMLEDWAQYYDTWDDWKTQVTNEWAEMQSFINHYFDNLNVQTEINNKIISMVNSGEFAQIVDPFIPPEVSSWLAEHITTPETVVIDDSLSIEGAAADAKATGDAINKLQSQITEIDDTIYNTIPYTWEIGSLSTLNGSEVDSTSRIRTGFMSIPIGTLYKITPTENILMLYEYNADKELTRVSGTGAFWHEASNQAGIFIRLVMRKDTSDSTISEADIPLITVKLSPNAIIESKISVLENEVDTLNNELFDTENWNFDNEITGKYINGLGNESTSENFAISKTINLSIGDTIKLSASGYSTAVAMIAEIASSTTYDVLVKSIDSEVRTYEYTATHVMEVAICYSLYAPHSCVIYRINYMPKGSIDISPEYLSLFENCACIGDSLTRGYQAEQPEGQRNRDGGYPTRLSRMTRLNVYNFGYSGATPTAWLSNATLNSYDYSIFDLAIICLGRNGGLSSETDRNSYESIIEMLQAANPNMTIFCLSLPPSYQDDSAINAIIKTIAENNNTYYVDITNDTQLSSAIYTSDGIHFYPLGYDLLAELIKDRICRYINAHKTEFMRIYTPKVYPEIIAGPVE